MIKPQLAEFMRRMDKDSVAIIPAAREAVPVVMMTHEARENMGRIAAEQLIVGVGVQEFTTKALHFTNDFKVPDDVYRIHVILEGLRESIRVFNDQKRRFRTNTRRHLGRQALRGIS